MKKVILFLWTIFAPLLVVADVVEIDGIYYNLIPKGHIAGVVGNPDQWADYKGDIVIPQIVNYQGTDYNVTSIGGSAFSYCSGLTSIVIPNSVTTIGDFAFNYCTGLTSIVIPNSVTTIGNSVFEDCTSLTSLTISNSVKTIGDYLCRRCDVLTSIVIPNSVTSIGEAAFAGCRGLTSLTIPNSVTTIGEGAFYSCHSLTSLTIPNSVKTIGKNVFTFCDGLTSLTIPNSVKTIGKEAFSYCSGLTSIIIPNSLTTIEVKVFIGCTGLTSVTIPNSVTSIEEGAFQRCSSLTNISIPNSVTSIGQGAFSSCQGLVSISIGDGIIVINEKAFEKCMNLTDLTCMAPDAPFTYNNAFLDSYIEYATLHVPATSIAKYKKATPWCDFGKIISADGGDNPQQKKCSTPTISYNNGNLKFDCKTEDVQFVSEIKDDDIRKYYDASLSLKATYNISVYATKAGYEDSEIATATLCWIDAEPMQEGTKEAEDNVTEVKAIPVLIQAEGNVITVQGAAEGTEISAYNVNGIKLSSTIANKGITTLNTQLPSGSTAIVKIGGKTVKVLVK